MVKCTFCGREEKFFKGIHYIRNVGVVNYYCSGKCMKNSLKLKRDKKDVRWTESFHETRNKARAKDQAAKTHAAGVADGSIKVAAITKKSAMKAKKK